MPTKNASLNIGLCRIDVVDMDSALSKIKALSYASIKGYVVTPNIDHLARLAVSQYKKDLKDIYFGASLSLCDSRILELILKAHGRKIPEVVTGSDLTAQLFETTLTKSDRVFILGGEEETIYKIRKRFPQIKIDHHNPSMGFINKSDEVKGVVDRIIKTDSDYVFLAVGSPQQEQIAKLLMENDDFRGIALCIGASILFLTGDEQRAPGWIQKLRLEWLYRLSQNPSRLAIRYLKNALSLPAINREISEHLRKVATQ